MITTLAYISFFTGGLLILLMLLSLLGGLDLDIDFGDSDIDTDTGGLGLIKSGLTFISVCCWVIRLILMTSDNPIFAIVGGIVGGLIAVAILTWLLNLLLQNQSNVNWTPEDALNKMAKVYLQIPVNGSGIVQIDIKGATRELKAITKDLNAISTGEMVYVHAVENDIVVVSRAEV